MKMNKAIALVTISALTILTTPAQAREMTSEPVVQEESGQLSFLEALMAELQALFGAEEEIVLDEEEVADSGETAGSGSGEPNPFGAN